MNWKNAFKYGVQVLNEVFRMNSACRVMHNCKHFGSMAQHSHYSFGTASLEALSVVFKPVGGSS